MNGRYKTHDKKEMVCHAISMSFLYWTTQKFFHLWTCSKKHSPPDVYLHHQFRYFTKQIHKIYSPEYEQILATRQ